MAKALPDYVSSFAVNYQVGWVPIPVLQPMGRVLSGLQTLSRYTVHEATRFSLPSTASWPIRLGHLKRCLLESRIPVNGGRELVIAHVHLEAFDSGGSLRSEQLAFIEDYARAEVAKGNYVVLGGDWNHLLAANPQEVRARFSATWPSWLQLLPEGFLAEFQWAYDEEVPRYAIWLRLMIRNIPSPAPSTAFGFAQCGILEVYGHDLGFEFSDHNPVTLRFKLRGDEAVQEDEHQMSQWKSWKSWKSNKTLCEVRIMRLCTIERSQGSATRVVDKLVGKFQNGRLQLSSMTVPIWPVSLSWMTMLRSSG